MYSIEDRQEAIRELQKYLKEAGDSAIPIVPTGVYDENTRVSVERFQEDRGLEKTGRANRETFELIYAVYLEILRKRLAQSIAGADVVFPLKRGNSTSELYRINNTLANIMKRYRIPHNIRRSEFFGEETAKAVRQIREIFGLIESEEIDEELYLRIYEDEASIEKASP